MDKNRLPRNVWVVGAASFFTDVSSEMIANLLPLFLKNVLGVKTYVIGLIEGAAETVASFMKGFSGWISDRLAMRKWLAVIGYALSSLSKVVYLFAASWGWVAGARWGDRLGKGIRTAPRDALVADSVAPSQRGFAFGFHRAADTAGAFVGLSIALVLVWTLQGGSGGLQGHTFRMLVWASLLPAFLAVAVLALGSRDVPLSKGASRTALFAPGLGRPFGRFMLITAIFELGNSSDAFLILRAQERGLSVTGIIGMLLAFNFVYTAVSLPAGRLSDRLGRKSIIAAGWALYALVYLGMALVKTKMALFVLYVVYGLYYGLTYGTAKALLADLVSPERRGTAYGIYNALLGLTDLPASLAAGFLWSGVGRWPGFGPSAPFFFGAAMAALACFFLTLWKPGEKSKS